MHKGHNIIVLIFSFRIDAPTNEELSHNLAIMNLKKINAAKLDEKYSTGKEKEPLKVTGSGTFPTYDEYETVVGKKKGNK